jgi:hypothetical protein
MNSSEIVNQLVSVFVPLFETLRQRLAESYPSLRFEMWSSPTGSETTYVGFDVGIECIFDDARDEEANCVAASIGAWHLNTCPEFDTFDVAWCNGISPSEYIDLLPNPIPVDQSNLSELAARFPELEFQLRAAIAARVAREVRGA